MPLNLKARASLAWRILRSGADARSLKHAERELLLAFPPDAADSDMPGWNDAMRRQLLELALVFSIQGNSGGSAMVAIPVLERLFRQEPLTPLTGEPDEWMDISEYGDGTIMYQNRRCSHVFKDGSEAYDIDGIVYEDPDGCRFTRGDRTPVTFPYMPTSARTVVMVDHDGEPLPVPA